MEIINIWSNECFSWSMLYIYRVPNKIGISELCMFSFIQYQPKIGWEKKVTPYFQSKKDYDAFLKLNACTFRLFLNIPLDHFRTMKYKGKTNYLRGKRNFEFFKVDPGPEDPPPQKINKKMDRWSEPPTLIGLIHLWLGELSEPVACRAAEQSSR